MAGLGCGWPPRHLDARKTGGRTHILTALRAFSSLGAAYVAELSRVNAAVLAYTRRDRCKLNAIARELNERPRKALGFETPAAAEAPVPVAGGHGEVLGVSALSVYNWEGGKSTPRRESLAAIVALRWVGKREALAQLARSANKPISFPLRPTAGATLPLNRAILRY